MAETDITVEILKEIRDETRGVRTELVTTNQRLGQLEERVDNRLGHVEAALLDLAQQQRLLVRYAKVTAERDSSLGSRVDALETRVDKLESK